MLKILSVLFCLGLYFQDLWQRRVHVALLVLLAGTGLVQRWMSGEEQVSSSLLSNLMFVLLIVGAVWLFYRLRGQRQFLDRKLGRGDIGMLLALACWMPTATFLWFYVLSTSGFLLFYGGLYLRGCLDREYPIPLAGLWGLAFAGWLLIQMALKYMYCSLLPVQIYP